MSTDKNQSCCGPNSGPDCCSPTTTDAARNDTVRGQVREGYARIAQTGSWSALQTGADSACGGSTAGGGCCGPATFTPEQLAKAIGYTQGELAVAPEGANMGLSCGNPTAIASLRPGEIVLDLGAGGGFDCFIAGAKVGATGKVIGVDMTPEMVTKARRNVDSYVSGTGFSNVEFRLGEIENLPVADASVDVVISNCVLNLSPDKPRVWAEIARVLKPGGRVAVSDLALLKPLPSAVQQDLEALVGCVAGAVLVEDTRAQATAVGLVNLVLNSKPQYIDAMMNWEDPLYRKIVDALPANSKPSDYITSLDVTAAKRR
jgi:SAM-dependent methyltransferase